MYLAGSGAMIQQMRLEVLANNIANADTIGFKEDKVVFSLMEAAKRNPADQETGNGMIQEISPYTPPFGQMTNFSTGSFKHTGNQLDLSIRGRGFFSIQTPDGVQYTRKGNFTIRDDGVLTTQNGHPVLGKGGEILIEGGTIGVDAQGNILVDDTEVGTLDIVDFPQKDALRKMGMTNFAPVDENVQKQAPENMRVNQGSVEMSNVNAIRAMTDMIETLRVFETYQKVIQSSDDATSKSINEVAKTV